MDCLGCGDDPRHEVCPADVGEALAEGAAVRAAEAGLDDELEREARFRAFDRWLMDGGL